MAICCEQQNKNVLNNLEREKGLPITYRLFLNKACTVSAEGDPGGEGDTPDRAGAASVSQGGRRRKDWRLPL